MLRTRHLNLVRGPLPKWLRALVCTAFLLPLVLPRGPARAAPLPSDPVEDFKQALKGEKELDRPSRDRAPAALKFRETLLTQKAGELRSLGEMSRALLLQEWKADIPDDEVAAIDIKVRDGIATRFAGGVRDILGRGTPAQKQAVADLISETANTSRQLSTRNRFLWQQLTNFAPPLIKVAESPDAPGRVRGAAAIALSNVAVLGDVPNKDASGEKIVAALQSLLRSDDAATRRAAAYALTNLVDVAYQQEKKARGSSGEEYLTAERKFLATGALVVPAAATGLTDSDTAVRRNSLEALRRVAADLADMVPDPTPATDFPLPGRAFSAEERTHVQEARRENEGLFNRLRPILQAFGQQSTLLSQVALDPDPDLRLNARRTMDDLANTRFRLRRREEAIPAEQLPVPTDVEKDKDKEKTKDKDRDKDKQTRLGALTMLTAVSLQAQEPPPAPRPIPGFDLPAILKALSEGLSDPDVQVRLMSLDVLESLGYEAVGAIPAVARALADKNKFVRWQAARILGRLAPSEPVLAQADLVVPGLTGLLADPDYDVRIATTVALSRLGPRARSAVPALARVIRGGDPEVRITAMHALEAIGADAAPALPAVEANLAYRDPKVQAAAAAVLGRFGPLAESSLPALQRALQDKDSEVRRAASEALLKVTGK